MDNPVERYCQVILHSGCTNGTLKHGWQDCPIKDFYRRIGRKHQHKLKSNGMAIGKWMQRTKWLDYLKQVKEQKGDYLALIDAMIEWME
jgi:hypothetical protein